MRRALLRRAAPLLCAALAFGLAGACAKTKSKTKSNTQGELATGDVDAEGKRPGVGKAPTHILGAGRGVEAAPRGPRTGAPMVTGPNAMTAAGLLELARSLADGSVEPAGDARSLQFSFQGVVMLLVVDEAADRMRIVAPIMQAAELGRDELHILMQANFHTALDSRYAVSDGVVYSVFIHPLSSLNEPQARSALEQVASLVATFGSTFSSTDVVFGG